MDADHRKYTWFCLLAFGYLGFPCTAWADSAPREVVKAAVKAHGGEDKIATSLTGTLLATAKVTLAPDVEAAISWEETFELPRRYKRFIKGTLNGEDFSLEYAVTEGSGWIRQNGGEAKDFKGKQLPLGRRWNAMLATLPPLLSEKVKLETAGKVQDGDRELVGVKVMSDDERYSLYFDSKSGLLAKCKRRMQHPLSGKEITGEAVFSDYKEVAGVQYPRRITTSSEGKKVFEIVITRIELLKKVADRVFDKQ